MNDHQASNLTHAEQKPLPSNLYSAVAILQHTCFTDALYAGWHNTPGTEGVRTSAENNAMFPTRLCLIHSEISEAMEGHRKSLQDDKLPHRPMAEVELADALIRIFDLGGVMGYDLAGALVEKMTFNRVRPDHKLAARAAVGGKAY